ncbi:MAG: hypothetical protein WD096_06145 [Actinomycetota bacterium]
MNNDTTISYGFDDDTPCCTVAWRLRAVDARDEWNDVGANFSFVASGLTVAGTYGCPTALPDNVQLVFMDEAFYDDWSDGQITVATANKCMIGSQIWYTAVSTNSYLAGDYYKGSDPTQIPNDEYDLQSFFTHELGHGTGTWGSNSHFFANSSACDGTLAYQRCARERTRARRDGGTWRITMSTRSRPGTSPLPGVGFIYLLMAPRSRLRVDAEPLGDRVSDVVADTHLPEEGRRKSMALVTRTSLPVGPGGGTGLTQLRSTVCDQAPG